MSRDQVVGTLLMVLTAAVIIVYGWVVFFTEWSLLLLQITGFVAVAGVFQDAGMDRIYAGHNAATETDRGDREGARGGAQVPRE